MSKLERKQSDTDITLAEACEVLETTLRGATRGEIVDRALKSGDLREAIQHLRSGMRSHVFKTGSRPLALDHIVRKLDSRTRQDGFHVLQAWDHGKHEFTKETIPVLLMERFAAEGIAKDYERAALAIFLDCYFLHVLALLVIRAWDDGDANDTLNRVTRLIRDLQGPNGSGRKFLDDAEMLLHLAISLYHPYEPAYDNLLLKVWTLNEEHRLNLALGGAAILGSHLRWGLQVMYQRDLAKMRDDNVVDYPWLLFSLVTLMREYARMHEAGVHGVERERVVEGLLNGLTPDPWAFLGAPPAALSAHRDEYADFCRLLYRHRTDLLEEFQRYTPFGRTYSATAFDFNFLHNAFVAMVAVSLVPDSTPNLSVNALLTSAYADGSLAESSAILARALMDYSGARPERLGEHGSRLVVYDPHAAVRSFTTTVRTIREHRADAADSRSQSSVTS